MSDQDPLRKLWKTRKEEAFTMSTAELESRAHRFQSKIQSRNLIEYAAAMLVIGMFGRMAVLIPEPVVKLGAVLIMIAAAYVCWKLHTLARAASKEDISGAVSLAAFHRAELVRQRDALSKVWAWYLAPFIPGMLLFMLGVNFSGDVSMPLMAKIVSSAVSLGFSTLVFYAIYWLNMRAVKKLDEDIAELDRATYQ